MQTGELQHTHSLKRAMSVFMVGKHLLRPQAAFSARNQPPTSEGNVSKAVYVARVGSPSANMALLQPSLVAAMCTAP